MSGNLIDDEIEPLTRTRSYFAGFSPRTRKLSRAFYIVQAYFNVDTTVQRQTVALQRWRNAVSTLLAIFNVNNVQVNFHPQTAC